MKKSDKSGVDRRKFLKGAAVGSVATLVGGTGALSAQRAVRSRRLPRRQGHHAMGIRQKLKPSSFWTAPARTSWSM